MNACAMKASSYLVANARIPVSENLTLAREDGGKRLRAFPTSTSIPPAPLTETTTPSGPPLSNQPVRLLSTERSVKMWSTGRPERAERHDIGASLLPVCWRGVSLGTRGGTVPYRQPRISTRCFGGSPKTFRKGHQNERQEPRGVE